MQTSNEKEPESVKCGQRKFVLDDKIHYVIINFLHKGEHCEKKPYQEKSFKTKEKARIQTQDAYCQRQGYPKTPTEKRPKNAERLMRPHSFARKERLKKASLISGVFDKGVFLKGRLVNIYLLKRDTDLPVNRAAFIIKKNLHNKKLVLRNRFRRLLREAYRKTKHLLPQGYDIVILAKNVKPHTSSVLLEEDLANVFKKYVEK